MSNYQQQLVLVENKLAKALVHVEYSWKKVQGLSYDITQLSEEQLATWESFSARFARLAELFLSRYLRTFSLVQDPGFEGSLRDRLFYAEKFNLLTNPQRWLGIRELRNVIAHDYSDSDLENYFQRLVQETPFLIQTIKNVLQQTQDKN